MSVLDDCTCPEADSLTDIPKKTCSINLNQIQRIGYQRLGNQFGTGATPVANSILELADWQALMVATNSTKIVVTPLISANPVITPGEAITIGGGDNSTLNGRTEINGVNPSEFACEFNGLSSEIEKAMKKIMCEESLVVYLFLQGGKIAAIQIDADNQKGFPISTPFISDRGNDGFGTKDKHTMSFSLDAGWSEDLQIFSPNFNPLTEL